MADEQVLHNDNLADARQLLDFACKVEVGAGFNNNVFNEMYDAFQTFRNAMTAGGVARLGAALGENAQGSQWREELGAPIMSGYPALSEDVASLRFPVHCNGRTKTVEMRAHGFHRERDYFNIDSVSLPLGAATDRRADADSRRQKLAVDAGHQKLDAILADKPAQNPEQSIQDRKLAREVFDAASTGDRDSFSFSVRWMFGMMNENAGNRQRVDNVLAALQQTIPLQQLSFEGRDSRGNPTALKVAAKDGTTAWFDNQGDVSKIAATARNGNIITIDAIGLLSEQQKLDLSVAVGNVYTSLKNQIFESVPRQW